MNSQIYDNVHLRTHYIYYENSEYVFYIENIYIIKID